MIDRADIEDRANEWGLRANVVEKDYVLGWLLAAVGSHPLTRDTWIFKGGTSIKKCYIETYRFSEDLDFTLGANAQYDAAALSEMLQSIAARAHDMSGLEFGDIVLRTRQNKFGELTFEARLPYRGPLGGPAQPRVRFDLTRFEELVLPSERRAILHAYPDVMPTGTTVASYAFDELMAEKTRALIQRTRPRDLYDVVYILDNHGAELNLRRTRDVLARKCAAKNVAMPTSAALMAIVRGDAELATDWNDMLRDQLPALPDMGLLINRLEELLGWLEPTRVYERPALVSATAGRGAQPALVAPRGAQFWRTGVPMETIRFAGANRLMVSFNYDGKSRLAEPYAIRRPATGNLLLYAWETASSHIKAFNVAKIQNLQISTQSFSPRYRVELAA